MSNAVSATETRFSAAQTHGRNPPGHGSLTTSCGREAVDMPIKRPVVTEIDLLRARQIVCSLMPLKRLSSDDAEIVARAIAEGIAGARKQGLDMAKADQEA